MYYAYIHTQQLPTHKSKTISRTRDHFFFGRYSNDGQTQPAVGRKLLLRPLLDHIQIIFFSREGWSPYALDGRENFQHDTSTRPQVLV